MQSPRSRRPEIEEVLRKTTEPLTVAQIARDSGCPVITVRRHLGAMLDDGVITKLDAERREAIGRTGRVPDLYQCTEDPQAHPVV